MKKTLLLLLLALLVAPQGALADSISGTDGGWVSWATNSSPDVSTGSYWDNHGWGADYYTKHNNIGYCLATTECGLDPVPGLMPFYGTNSGGAVNNITFDGAGTTYLLTFQYTDASLSTKNVFGWYYLDGDGNPVEAPLFTGASAGATTLFTSPTGSYGFYFTTPDCSGKTNLADCLADPNVPLHTWFSNTSENQIWQEYDQSNDQHFAIFSPNHLDSNPTYWIGAEDLPFQPDSWSSDRNYTDATIEMRPVPEPGSLYLFGTGLVGLLGLRYRLRKRA